MGSSEFNSVGAVIIGETALYSTNQLNKLTIAFKL